jgi:putative membrane protein
MQEGSSRRLLLQPADRQVWKHRTMRSFIGRVLINALALWIASWVLPGLDITTSAATDAVAKTGVAEGTDVAGTTLAYLFIGLIFGLVNAFIRPLVSFLSLPITILTLGLFTIVISAAMLYVTSWISSFTPVHFTIDSFFWTAVLAAIIITLISLVAGRLTGVRR